LIGETAKSDGGGDPIARHFGISVAEHQVMRKPIVMGTAFGVAVAAAALVGSRFNPAPGTKAGRWYRRLDKSPLNPPDGVFAPVWTTLYAAMAVSAFRVWASDAEEREKSKALKLWSAQLALNTAWNPLFFGARQPVVAFADLSCLAVTLLAYMRTTAKIDRTAAALFVPYVLWVAFAGFLNEEIIRRNA
jgi:benzodiazapine receptor